MVTKNKLTFNYPKELGLTEDEKLMTLLESWNPIVTDDDDYYNSKLVWCLENCQGKFRDIRAFETRTWYFQHERDASLFALKWA